MKRKRIGDADDLLGRVAVGGGIAVAGYFLVVKPLMNVLGINPADTESVNDQISTAATDNPFNAMFKPAVDYYNSHPGKDADGNPLTINVAFQQIKAAYDSGTLAALAASDSSYSDIYKIAQIAEKLNDIYFWQWLKGYSADDVISLFSEISTQLMLAELSEYMLYNFNVDLLPGLRAGLLKFGLNDTQLAGLISEINNLPRE
jgi:hypothetical protein